ncbi:hypothetical protein E4U31_002562, partial [Claviceps sp. LM219 group G6]
MHPRLHNRNPIPQHNMESRNMDSNSTATGQPPFNGPHRSTDTTQPGTGGPDYKRCTTCHLMKPLQDFKSLRVSHYVLRCITCRSPQSSTPVSV